MANVPSIGPSKRWHSRDRDPASGPGHRSRRDQRRLQLLEATGGGEGGAHDQQRRNPPSKDYERLLEVTEEAIDHIKGVDPHIRPQLTLSSQKNFVDEIADQTRSGFGPDLLITDSDTALELYRRKLVDPIDLSPEDRADTPSYLFDLVTANDGQLVGRPVNQFVQLACFNKERMSSPPQTLE